MNTKKSAIDVVSKLKQRTVVNAISATNWEFGNDTPFVVELDPTAACDLACPGCISEDIIAEGGRFSKERLLSLGKEMADAGVKGVILIGGGEPLSHPAVGDLMRQLHADGVKIGITTNGSFIDKHLEVIAETAFWTRVSMDAATDETFQILRPSKTGKSKFNQIIKNIRNLSEIKKGLLGYSYLIQSPEDGSNIISNAKEIYAAAALSKEIGCDYFEVKPSYQFRNNVAHALMLHSKSDRDAAREEVNKLYTLEDDNFKIYSAINLQASLDGLQVPQDKQYHFCPAAHMRTLVTPKGVFVCPYWRGKKPFMVGDVSSMSFSEMWHGDLRNKVMNKLDPSKHCNFHCLRHGSNIALIDMKDKMLDGESLEVVDDYDPFI